MSSPLLFATNSPAQAVKNNYYELHFEDGSVEHGYGPYLDVALFRLGLSRDARGGLKSWKIMGAPGGLETDEHD